jgi:CO dehydrogenase/acetyl-CoA synthase delta subunit
MRWGIGRERYRVAPGLYAVGQPDEQAPVLVSANYKLSFDALRKELGKIDAWILVIDTKGINVWCAAGKGTFGTEEIVRRVKACQLDQVVSHRQLILPQLGAPGVAAHNVTKQTGFRVIYGPVRAGDLPAFLHSGLQATPSMRRVTFTTRERLILTPVELVTMNKVTGWVLLGLFILGGIDPAVYSLGGIWHRGLAAAAVYIVGLLVGAVVTPGLLPWIPGPALAFKGLLAGVATALIACGIFAGQLGFAYSIALLLALPAVASFCAMNFTGSTSYTSPSGVNKEMRRAIPLQALAVLVAGVAWFWGTFAAPL